MYTLRVTQGHFEAAHGVRATWTCYPGTGMTTISAGVGCEHLQLFQKTRNDTVARRPAAHAAPEVISSAYFKEGDIVLPSRSATAAPWPSFRFVFATSPPLLLFLERIFNPFAIGLFRRQDPQIANYYLSHCRQAPYPNLADQPRLYKRTLVLLSISSLSSQRPRSLHPSVASPCLQLPLSFAKRVVK